MLETQADSILTGLLVAPTLNVEGKPVEQPYMPQINAILAAESNISLTRAKKLFAPAKTSKTLAAEVADCQFILADVSQHLPGVYFYMGLAKALKKTLVAVNSHGSQQAPWVERTCDFVIHYEDTPDGLEDFTRKLREIMNAILRAENLDHQVLMGNYQGGAALEEIETDTEDDEAFGWDHLSDTEHENLCLELLLRNGLSEVTWLEKTNEIDLIALRPLEGKTYDLFLVSIGSGLEDEMTMQLWMTDFQNNFNRIVEISQIKRLRRAEDKFVLNLFFIWSPDNPGFNVTKNELQKLYQRIWTLTKKQFTVRCTVWTRNILENFVRQSPMLVRKYFTQEWREGTEDRRKNAEELYRDAAEFVQRAVDAAQDLEKKYGEDPGKKWQHLAYTATHSIGNAIFPVEIYIDQLGEIMDELGSDDGRMAVERAQTNIEKAKVHIKKFKSIASSKEGWTLSELDIAPHIERSLETARSQEIDVNFFYQEHPEVHADPDRIDEIFDEFVANSANWLENTVEPQLNVTMKVANPDDLPASLEQGWAYLWVRFADNGPGIKHEVKSKIFDLFYSESMQGMGFGLAIARKNMRGFGGDVIETGTPGQGAQFDFFFRIAP